MNNKLVLSDFIVFAIYFVLVASYGYWVYHKKKKKSVTATHDFSSLKALLPGGP